MCPGHLHPRIQSHETLTSWGKVLGYAVVRLSSFRHEGSTPSQVKDQRVSQLNLSLPFCIFICICVCIWLESTNQLPNRLAHFCQIIRETPVTRVPMWQVVWQKHSTLLYVGSLTPMSWSQEWPVAPHRKSTQVLTKYFTGIRQRQAKSPIL